MITFLINLLSPQEQKGDPDCSFGGMIQACLGGAKTNTRLFHLNYYSYLGFDYVLKQIIFSPPEKVIICIEKILLYTTFKHVDAEPMLYC